MQSPRSVVQRSGGVRLESAGRLSEQPGPPQTTVPVNAMTDTEQVPDRHRILKAR